MVRLVATAFLLLLVQVAAMAREADTDSALRRLIVGRWTETRVIDCETHKQYMTVKSDGTFEIIVDLDLCGQKVKHVWSGTWDIKAGHFEYVVLRSDLPKVTPVGIRLSDQILTINEAEWVMVEQSTGHRSVATRVGRE